MLQGFDRQPALGADWKGISRDRCTILVGPGGWRSKLETGGGSGGCVCGSAPGFSSLEDPLVFCGGDLFQPRERGFPRLGWHGSASSSSTSSDNGVYCLISASCGTSRSLAEGVEPNSSLILWRCLEQFGFICGVSLCCVGSLINATTLSPHCQENRYPLHCAFYQSKYSQSGDTFYSRQSVLQQSTWTAIYFGRTVRHAFSRGNVPPSTFQFTCLPTLAEAAGGTLQPATPEMYGISQVAGGSWLLQTEPPSQPCRRRVMPLTIVLQVMRSAHY